MDVRFIAYNMNLNNKLTIHRGCESGDGAARHLCRLLRFLLRVHKLPPRNTTTHTALQVYGTYTLCNSWAEISITESVQTVVARLTSPPARMMASAAPR
jgi:hypothetical protein